jgi:hypothetical protein
MSIPRNIGFASRRSNIIKFIPRLAMRASEKKGDLCIAGVIALSLFLGGCASVTGFEEARTIGNGNHELMPSANAINLNNFFGDDDDIFYVNLELKYRYGIADNVDLGMRLSSTMNFGVFTKVNIIDNPEGNFALGCGLELASTLGLSAEVHLPVYLSFYPNDNVTWNFSPRLITQNAFDLETVSYLSYLGANGGILLASGSSKIGLDIGYFQNIDGRGGSLFTFGMAGKFLISGQ